MNPPNPKETALQTWDACCALLPKNIVENLRMARCDPAPLKKKDTNIMRLRILPKNRKPLEFWCSAWCTYEIGIGVYDGRMTVGGVSFVQFPNQKACGAGKYTEPTLQILKNAQALRADFVLTPASFPDISSTSLARRYLAQTHPCFPVELAAQDLRWLIQTTLPQFECL